MKCLSLILTGLFIVQYSAAQTYAWALPLGSSQYDGVSSVATDINGNMIVTGHVQGTMDLDPGNGTLNVTSNGSSDVFVAKYNPNGDLIWGFSFGSTQFESASTVWVDNNNDIYIGGGFRLTVDFDPGNGVFNMTSAGHLDIYILKLDSGGNFIWAKRIGGFEEDSVEGIATDAIGNVIVTGMFYEVVDFDPNGGVQNLDPDGATDIYIFKWTSDGNYIWAKRIGSNSGEISYDVVTDASGIIYATGLFWGNTDFDPNGGVFNLNGTGGFNSYAFVLKWDGDGNFIWAGMFNGDGGTVGYELGIDSSQNIVIAGSFAGTGDFDPGNGTFNMTGDTNSLFHNIFVLKLTNAGNFIWAKNIGVNGSNQAAYALDLSPSSDIWITGLFSGTVDFDPGAGVSSFTVAGPSDGFVVELDSSGNHLFSGVIGGTQDDYCNSISLYNNTAVYVGGLFTWFNTDLDPTTGIDLYNSNSNGNDAFVVKLGLQNCESDFTTSGITICQGDSVDIGGTWQNTPGVYSETFVNEAGCDSIVEVTLQWHPVLEYEITTTPASSCDPTGSASVVVTGTEPFEYLWNDALGQTSATALNLEYGNYQVEVTDGNGCVTEIGVEVEMESPCIGDYNYDEVVNIDDLLMFIPFVGCQGNCCPYDSDLNSVVNVNDLLMFMANFGLFCQ